MTIAIEKVSYNNPKDLQLLKVILSEWFKNPKELNWIDPRIHYPFNFNNWVKLTYNNSEVNSFVLKEHKRVIGIGNVICNRTTKHAHALHIFIDPKYREKGFATKMLKYLESIAKKEKMKKITINVMPKNIPAAQLYEKLGFQKKKSNGLQWFQFQKSLVSLN